MVSKSGETVSRTIKKEAIQLSQTKYTQERQELWAKLDSMENFGIEARGLALKADLLVHPSIITKEGHHGVVSNDGLALRGI